MNLNQLFTCKTVTGGAYYEGKSDQMLDLGDLLIRRGEVVAVWEEDYKGLHTWVKLRDGGHRKTSMPLKDVRRIVFGDRDAVYFATSVCTQGLELKETK